MEVAPGVLPALVDRLGGDVEAVAQRALAVVVGVDREAAVDFFDALGEDVQQLRELGLAAGDDDASQRNALLSFSKKPSSGLYVRSSACASKSSSSRRCSSLR
jgi:outer membrane murein-binding lipoprotein Lpp